VSVYRVYRFSEFLVKWVPEPIARRVSSAVGRLMCHLQQRNRTILYRNLEVAFGTTKSPAELRKLRMDIFANFGYEFVHLPHLTRHNVDKIFTPGSLEAAQRLGEMTKDGPVISVSAHLGYWELAVALVGIAGIPINVLVDLHEDSRVSRFFDELRMSKGTVPVPVTSVTRIYRALRRNAVVAIAVDRAVTGQGITATYFGQEFLAPDGHAVLGRKFGAKLVPTFCMMQEDGRYDFTIGAPIEVAVTDDAEADIRACVDECLAYMESRIREHPEQWFAFRPTWGVECRDRLRSRKSRQRRSRRRADKRAREAVNESHGLRERNGSKRRGRDV